MPFTLKLGPIRYDSRKGVLSWRTRSFRAESRTRKERVTSKAAKAKAREARRQLWRDLHSGTGPGPAAGAAGSAAAKRAAAGPVKRPVNSRPPTAPLRPAAGPQDRPPVTRTRPGPEPAPAVESAPEPATPDEVTTAALAVPPAMDRKSLAQWTKQVRGAGLCGTRTRDGTPCLRKGKCPPGTHTRRNR